MVWVREFHPHEATGFLADLGPLHTLLPERPVAFNGCQRRTAPWMSRLLNLFSARQSEE